MKKRRKVRGRKKEEEKDAEKSCALVALAGLIAAAFRNSNAEAIARRWCGKSRSSNGSPSPWMSSPRPPTFEFLFPWLPRLSSSTPSIN